MGSLPRILIVGSGPSGLTLALSLRRNGIPVRVIEKSTIHRFGQRGAGIMPRSLELFEQLGIYDAVASRAMRAHEMKMRMYKMPEGVEVLKEWVAGAFEEPTPSIPYNNIILLGQNNLDKILRAELSKAGCEVELGVELQTFMQSEDHVKVTLLRHGISCEAEQADPVTEEATYDWVIGADGARGAVRHVLGLKLLGETIEQKFVVGDMELEGLEANKWHIWGDMSNHAVSIRGTEDKGVFNFIIGGAKLDNPEEVAASQESTIAFIRKHTNRPDINLGNISWTSPYRVNIRMAETFRQGRVFLIGDAAHIHSPAGGQGMNTGLQDGFNLGWKLALVAKGLAPKSLLDSFNEERVPVVSQMLNITTALLMKMVTNNDESGWDRSGNIKQLGINYRWSSFVVDEDREAKGKDGVNSSAYDGNIDGTLAAGDRAPDATELYRQSQDSTRLFKLFSPTKHTVLLFSGSNKGDFQPDLDAVKKYPVEAVQSILIVEAGKASDIIVPSTEHNFTVVEDRKRHAHEAYKGVDGAPGILVIRPDGVVGARVRSSQGLDRYFKSILIVPTSV